MLAYARVSSVEQSLGTSLQDQQDAILAYAQARGLKVFRYYVEAESAIHEKTEKREQIQLLLKEAKGGDLIVCDKLDRWSRDPEFTYGSIRRLLELGASFYAVGDQCDPSTSDGDTMLGVRVLVAREEHKRIKERTVGARRRLRDLGYYIEGHVPVGYVRPTGKGVSRLDHNILAVDLEGAEAVREIYRMCCRGVSVGAIGEHLDETRRKRKWDKKLVNKTLRNRLYLGELRDTRGVWIKGKHPPLIDADLFTRAQAALDSRRLCGSGPHTESRTKDWLLRTLGRCARCGGMLTAAYGGGPLTGAAEYTYYYRCRVRCPGSRHMQVKNVDPVVADMMVARLIELRVELARGPEPKKVAKLIDFTVERARLQSKRDRYLEAFSDDDMTKAELRTALAKVDESRTKLEAKAAEQARRSPLEMVAVRRDILANVERIRVAWKGLRGQLRRETLGELANAVRIEYGRDPIVDWRSLEEMAGDERP